MRKKKSYFTTRHRKMLRILMPTTIKVMDLLSESHTLYTPRKSQYKSTAFLLLWLKQYKEYKNFAIEIPRVVHTIRQLNFKPREFDIFYHYFAYHLSPYVNTQNAFKTHLVMNRHMIEQPQRNSSLSIFLERLHSHSHHK